MRQSPLTNSLASIILDAAERWPEREAIVMPSVRWDYQTMLARGLAVASALRAAGLQRGERIGIIMEDSPTYLELVLGSVLLGVVPVLFNESTRGDHLDALLDSLGLKILYASKCEKYDFLCKTRECAPVVIEVDSNQASVSASYASFIEAGKASPMNEIVSQVSNLRAGDPLVILFTSAVSCGIPKTCVLNNHDVLDKVPTFLDRIKLGLDSRLWIPLHMFQIGFFAPWAAALATGAAVIASDKFEPTQTLQLLRQETITHAYPVYPSFWLPIIQSHDFFPSDFAALTHVVLLGPFALLRRVQRALPHCSVMNTYGAAEQGGAMCMPFDTDPADIRLGSIGRPYPGQKVRIADPLSAKICQIGEVGEIQIMQNADHLAHAFGSSYTEDHWLRTSDLGTMSADGVIHFHGRLTEMLNISGKAVSATRIEAVLSEHPAVSVIQVVAVKGADTFQSPAAFIELRPGFTTDASELIDFCRSRMDKALVPSVFHFVDAWPMSASKINKSNLQALIQ